MISITLYECPTTPPTTLDAIQRASFSVYSKAVMSGAEAMALASGHTIIIEIALPGSIERIWVNPPAPIEQPAELANLKARKAQPGYQVFTGAREDVIGAAKQHPGAIARANGGNGCWLLLIPQAEALASAA